MNANETKVRKKLEKVGCVVLRNGWPDFLVITDDGKIYGLEVKSGTDKLKKEQELMHACLSGIGLPVYTCCTSEDPIKLGVTMINQDWGEEIARRATEESKKYKKNNKNDSESFSFIRIPEHMFSGILRLNDEAMIAGCEKTTVVLFSMIDAGIKNYPNYAPTLLSLINMGYFSHWFLDKQGTFSFKLELNENIKRGRLNKQCRKLLESLSRV